jgi:cytochrome P450
LREEEAAGLSIFFSAGIDSPTDFLSTAFYVLSEHPDQRALLIEDHAAIPNGVEELLRFDAPFQKSARITTREVELHGRKIPQQARVLLLWGSANRDERRFDDPDRLDVKRKPERHLSFGDGIHHCLGAPLMRLMARTALQSVLTKMPEYEVVGPMERAIKQNSRGFRKLPVAF